MPAAGRKKIRFTNSGFPLFSAPQRRDRLHRVVVRLISFDTSNKKYTTTHNGADLYDFIIPFIPVEPPIIIALLQKIPARRSSYNITIIYRAPRHRGGGRVSQRVFCSGVIARNDNNNIIIIVVV